MRNFDAIVIGAGASGIVAAISAKRKGMSVLLCEKMPQIGKKILASGSGRCNLSNDKITSSFYNPAARRLTDAVFAKFSGKDIVKFFRDIGLEVYSDNGRIFPVTNQSASVLKILEMELTRLSVPVEVNCEITGIAYKDGAFTISPKKGEKRQCRKVILTGGGKAYPAFGSDGTSYKFAKQFGHRIIEPVPSAVPLVVKDEACHLLQGQRISAKARSIVDGKIKSEAAGDVLFTKYGLSGTAVLDISEDISIALNREHNKDVAVSIDMIPFMEDSNLRNEIEKRFNDVVSQKAVLFGLLPNKFDQALKNMLGVKDIATIVGSLKDRRFKVSGTRGWNEAEFTAGGVDVGDVNEATLESKLRKGLYFAGEILDVNGKRGGYNLAWAWASGFVAGAGAV
ncbi:MAG: NAD(P)/FAD-dependent oxidoreductase [Candidatus Omnitrophica bacterium]|nr:NAD(P)/FAD-dependent oxidoreductase [Candidatus Omnitrophota bacterium]MBU4487704.1 NAD(P)/FAD-dependent oxidoreductase [Candidatus Omnitrophota bacterium]MCG2705810.1 NAD(P)/FAD-dependent oxidoreductase [Candidatus Omnitrophota bacterium]